MINKNMVGTLDKRISILKEVQIDDGHNGVTSTFPKVCDAWANIFHGSGSENYKFGRVFQKDSYVFIIRSRPDLTILTNYIVEFDGERMNITWVSKIDGRELYMAIEATKGAGV